MSEVLSLNKNRPLRVAAIHDLSGFGRCSLSVIMPTLSVVGLQVCPVPTAVMSTHTGDFTGVVMKDLTDYISPALKHYLDLGIDFDCVYSGFLGGEEQIDHCLEFFDSFKNAFCVVDPVMGDNGKPYRTYTKKMINRMIELVRVSKLTIPNLTECYMLLGEPYSNELISRDKAKKLLLQLSEKGPDQVIITGVPLSTGVIANIGFDKNTSSFWKSSCEYIPVSYPGTGDIFASVVIGAILSGESLPIAIARATSFLELAIKTTFSYGATPREGVMLEKVLPALSEKSILQGSRYSVL